MDYQPAHAVEILTQTPATLRALLSGLSAPGTRTHAQAEAWSPYDVLGHLIHGEETDWIPRAQMILRDGPTRPFESFDRFAQFARSQGQSLDALLETFAQARARNLATLAQLNLSAEQWALRGLHPELGTVTLAQLIATWAVHDLDHIGQIVTALAKQYTEAVGPWRAYLGILEK